MIPIIQMRKLRFRGKEAGRKVRKYIQGTEEDVGVHRAEVFPAQNQRWGPGQPEGRDLTLS